jgi:IS5 family transposase
MEASIFGSPLVRPVTRQIHQRVVETTILNFRHLLEEHDFGGQILDAVNFYLASRGIRITELLMSYVSPEKRSRSRNPLMTMVAH